MKNHKSSYLIITILLVTILLLSFVSCKQDPSTLRTYQPPENIEDGLKTGTLEEVNMDKVLIEKAISDINRGKYGEVHSLLIYKDGGLVVEEYFTGHKYQWDAPGHHGDLIVYNRDTLHRIMSDTKSIVSILIGLAIENGYIESVDQSIFDYLPEHQDLKTDGKDKITIENLLTMESGLKWDEWSASLSSTSNDAIGIWFSDKDPVIFVLERPFVYEPGTRFIYSGGNMEVLGEIIQNATGMNVEEFAGKYLFELLGINSFTWEEFGEYYNCAGGLSLTPRDMLKIGVTFLNNGAWDGKQVISEQWVKKSAFPFGNNTGINVPGTDSKRMGYSYSWWTKDYSLSGKEINIYYAGGWGGQRIMVLPEVNSVIVFTGGNYTSTVRTFKILEKYIFPAIK